MNDENFNKWCDVLVSGEIPQARSTLVEDAPEGYAMCCLGVGLKVMGHEPTSNGFNIQGYPYNSLPPTEFLTWLGLVDEEEAERILAGSPTSVHDLKILFHDFEVLSDGDTPYPVSDSDFTSCAGMNDNGFTFKEIVDCMRYFGVSRWE